MYKNSAIDGCRGCKLYFLIDAGMIYGEWWLGRWLSHMTGSVQSTDAIEAAEAVGLRPPWRSYSQAHFSHAHLAYLH